MIRKFCDKCDKEIKGGYVAKIYEYNYEEYGFKNDLCLECAIEVQNFIKSRGDVEERLKGESVKLIEM